MILEERLKEVKGTRRSNCIGTALYLIGKLSIDEYVDPFTSYDLHLAFIPVAREPLVGGLVVWIYDDNTWPSGNLTIVNHLAVISRAEPFLVHNRHGADGKFIENQHFELVNSIYGPSPHQPTRIKLYQP